MELARTNITFDSIKVLTRNSSFVISWLNSENYYLSEIQKNTYELNTKLIARKVVRYNSEVYGNKLYGYYLSKSDFKDGIFDAYIYLLNDDDFYSLKYENTVSDFYINESAISGNFIGQYIILSDNNYYLMQSNLDKTLKYTVTKIPSQSEELIKVLTKPGNINDLIIIDKNSDLVSVKILLEGFVKSEVMLYKVSNLLFIPYENNILLLFYLDENKYLGSYKIDFENNYIEEYSYITDYKFDFIFISASESDSNIIYGINANQLIKNEFNNNLLVKSEIYNFEFNNLLESNINKIAFIGRFDSDFIFQDSINLFNINVFDGTIKISNFDNMAISNFFNGHSFIVVYKNSVISEKKVDR